MNYLAHMVLGEAFGLTDHGVVGNFMGDAVKGRFVERHWSPEVSQGIRFHRSLDATSDGHEASREARALIRPHCGKWSGVVWDVLADHVLASHFGRLAPNVARWKHLQQGNWKWSKKACRSCPSAACGFSVPWCVTNG